MRLQPIFGEFQRDGKNKNGLTMFKCLHCGRRSSWAKKEHGHPEKEEVQEEEIAEE